MLLPCARAAILPPQTVEIAGTMRTYYLYVPPVTRPAGHPPLLVVLHWTSGDGRAALRTWTPIADREGMVLVAPNSTTPVGWRIREDGPAFLHTIVETVAARTPIDPRRVYLFGVSAGAIHALTIGVVESEYFAAVAIHAGSWRDRESFKALDFATRKIPIAITIGDRDELFSMKSVRETKAALVAAGHAVTLTVMPGEHHEYSDVAKQVNRDAWAFLGAFELPAEPRFREYR
jgi:poly(3-hydroxybutyrate) depolymerase